MLSWRTIIACRYTALAAAKRTHFTRTEPLQPMPTEADTCRTLITPKLQAAGWEGDPHSIAEQRTFTDGRIILRGNTAWSTFRPFSGIRAHEKVADWETRRGTASGGTI